MDFIFKYSGLLVVLFSWVMVVIPYFLFKKKNKLEALSDIGAISGRGSVQSIGLMLVSISQMVFWTYISINVQTVSVIRSALILYYSSFNLFVAGVIHRGLDRTIHDMFVHNYFIFSLVGAYLLSTALAVIDLNVSVILRLLIGMSGLGAIILYCRKKWVYAELWSIVLSSVWIITVYLYIL